MAERRLLRIEKDDTDKLELICWGDGTLTIVVEDFAGSLAYPHQSASITLNPAQVQAVKSWLQENS